MNLNPFTSQLAHKLASPRYFYQLSTQMIPWFLTLFGLTFITGLVWGLIYAPPDYQQGDSYRIIFVHVPAAWLSLFVYVVMAFAGAVGLIWRIKVTDPIIAACAPIGAMFTAVALITGSLWGKPMWGTYWQWDARLTSELILLFLYLGVIGLYGAFEDRQKAAKAAAILAIVGVVNVPIIHYSVEWWNTLHQPATITKLDKPSMDASMLQPLLLMAISFKLFFASTLLMRARNEVLLRERHSRWVREIVETAN